MIGFFFSFGRSLAAFPSVRHTFCGACCRFLGRRVLSSVLATASAAELEVCFPVGINIFTIVALLRNLFRFARGCLHVFRSCCVFCLWVPALVTDLEPSRGPSCVFLVSCSAPPRLAGSLEALFPLMDEFFARNMTKCGSAPFS